MDTNDQIYLGIWTNWSRGSATMGATLTTTQSSGNIIIAFTAIFIPFVASRLWKMLCFAFHSCVSKRGAQDAIYHQRQVVLRNSSSPDSSLFSLLLLMWAWRGLNLKKVVRLLPLLIFAILFIVGFTLAGGYSSQISSVTGNEVLIKGDKCGVLGQSPGNINYTTSLAYSSWLATALAGAADYVQQCYANQGATIFDCNKYVVQRLPTESSDGNFSCPFVSDICRDNSKNLRLDTGYLDSNDHLGLNTPPHQRFAWRKVLSCAPLKTHGYKSSHIHYNNTFIDYHYGNAIAPSDMSVNYTYSVPDLVSQYTQSDPLIAGQNFRVLAHFSQSFNGSLVKSISSFTPDGAIETSDGDIALVFLSGNGIVFTQESNDAWYNATTQFATLDTPNADGSGAVYAASEAATPLGCVQQYQWCNSEYPVPEGCGPLAGFVDSVAGAYPLFNLTMDDYLAPNISSSITERGSRIEWASLVTSQTKVGIYDIVQTLGAKALASQSLLSAGIQLGLSKNQWQIDVINWWNMSLALSQAAFVNTALGYRQSNPDLQAIVDPPVSDADRHLCQSQKVRQAGFASFSLFGLLFTYILGGLIILMSFALDPLMRCLHKRREYRQYQYLEWRTNSALQLQRLAQDELGYGKWIGCTDMVPVTRPEDRLADLDISDLKYPKLNRETVVEEVKPQETNMQAETVASLHGSAEASDDTVTNVDAEDASIEPGHTSEAVDESNSVLEGQECPESHTVSMVSMEDIDQVQTVPDRPVSGNDQGPNASHQTPREHGSGAGKNRAQV